MKYTLESAQRSTKEPHVETPLAEVLCLSLPDLNLGAETQVFSSETSRLNISFPERKDSSMFTLNAERRQIRNANIKVIT